MVVNLRTSYLTKTAGCERHTAQMRSTRWRLTATSSTGCYLLPIDLVHGMCAIRSVYAHPETDNAPRYTGRPTTNFLGL